MIDLWDGHLVTYEAEGTRFEVPGCIIPQDGKLVLDAPQPLLDWISASDTRVSVTTEAGRFTYTCSKIETYDYQAGWP